MKENVIKDKSFKFAVRVINLYKKLIDEKEFVLSKQLLRSGTLIGANIRESQNAQSPKDFIHKLFLKKKQMNRYIGLNC